MLLLSYPQECGDWDAVIYESGAGKVQRQTSTKKRRAGPLRLRPVKMEKIN
jgi:hypothetical protein